jgi:uncharacterized membrane protein YeaQ/YmgE (transglycosylase-associated protein family)
LTEEAQVNIIAWIIVGLIGGALAKFLMPGNDPGGIILTIVLGVAGALLGGFLSIALGIGNGVDDFDIGTIALSIFGSILILLGYRAVASRA